MAAALIDSSYVTRSCGSMCVCARARVCKPLLVLGEQGLTQ